MFEREDIQKIGKLGTSTTLKHHSQNGLQDLVLSLSHRLSVIQNSLSSKIDRTQCMIILESKANFSQVKKVIEQLNSKQEKQRAMTEERMAEQKRKNKKELEVIKEKLKGKKKQARKSQQKITIGLKSQQLYLQSNQTMFSLIVDEITGLKQAQEQLQRNLQQRNKVTINLNNEVCSKIQNLQRQIQMSIKVKAQNQKQQLLSESSHSWASIQEKSLSRARDSHKNNFQKTEKITGNVNSTTNQFSRNNQTHQISHILRTLESLQKEISSKINIKDILPIIKKNIQPVSSMIDEVKKYTEDAVESTKKILINQSQINQELCTVSKLAWWQSFEEKNGFTVWNKQIANLAPQNYIFEKDTTQIVIVQQGTYIIKVLTPNEYMPEFIIINGYQHEFLGESLIKVDKNTVIQIPSSGDQIFLSVLKL